jgi:O-antigen/teichoic acid export membrane protein
LTDPQKSYTQILKSTSIFGGVQIFNIIIGIVRSKLVAVLLGSVGIGLMGLYTTVVSLLSSLTNFGLGQSAVRHISEANENQGQARVGSIIYVLNRLVFLTGTVGAVIAVIFSKQISRLTFDSDAFTIPIIWLSVSVFFQTVTNGSLAVLQGFRKVKLLAKANVIGALLGLIASAPLYYFFGQEGIVPAIIVTSVLSYLIAWYSTRKLEVVKKPVNKILFIEDSKQLFKLGILLSLSSILSLAAGYILRIFISKTGGISDVGFFQAGWAIINGYIGMIFTAMATDYYPRLSGVNRDNQKTSDLVNQQAIVAVLLLAPLLSMLFPIMNIIIRILYTSEFIVIRSFLIWAIIGIFLRSVNWAVSYIYLAKGDTTAFLILEIATNVLMTVLYIAGYMIYGLAGIGIALIVGNAIRIPAVYWDLNRRYSFKFIPEFNIAFLITGIVLILGFFTAQYSSGIWRFIIPVPIIVFISFYSYKELNRRIKFKELLMNRLNEKQNNS